MNKISKNAIANIITKLWTLVSVYIFIPFYIKFLGEESYGIVSFFATMQTAINVLGLGLANTLRREFAVKTYNEDEDNIRRNKLLHCIEIIYWIIACIVSVTCFWGSNNIASSWLNVGSLLPEYVAMTITLMGISISIQIVANLYSGCVFGLDLQASANGFQIIWSILKYCGSLFIIMFVVVDLRAFYLWHVVTDIAYLLVLRIYLAIKIKPKKKYKWSFSDFVVLKSIWKYAIGVFVISIIALVNKQLDKIIISNLLSLTELGAYNLATTLGGLTTVFSTAMYVSVFPSFTSDIALGNKNSVQERFLSINKLVNIITLCMCCYVAVFAIPLIQFWTRTTAYNDMLQIAAPLVIMAVSITELQEIPYALALAYGNTKINAILGLSYLPIVCVTTWYSIKKWGLVGAGSVYFILMISQSLIYEYAIYKKYLQNNPIRLIIRDTIVPLIISAVLAFLSYNLVLNFDLPNSTVVLIAIVCGGATLVIEMLLLNRKQLKVLLHSHVV